MRITNIMIFWDEKYNKAPQIIYRGNYMTEYDYSKSFEAEENIVYHSKEELINSL